MSLIEGLKVTFRQWQHQDPPTGKGTVVQTEVQKVKRDWTTDNVLFLIIMSQDGKFHIKESKDVFFKDEDIQTITEQPIKIIREQRAKKEERIASRSDILDL